MRRTTRKFYHVTSRDIAERILKEGFRDGCGYYGMGTLLTGVWISDEPLSVNEGAKGETVLEITLSWPGLMMELRQRYECIESLKSYREWILPAAILNPMIAAIEIRLPS